MKKLLLGSVVLFMSFSLMGCNTNKTEEENSVSSSSLVEDMVDEETEEMEQMEEDLNEKGVEMLLGDYLHLTRQKGLDYDYFDFTFSFDSRVGEVIKIRLTLKGNIDGKEKEDLIYKVSQGRIVESEGDNTDIKALAEVLKSIDYSDKELVEFAQWYYRNN